MKMINQLMLACLMLVACNPIPNKSVFEELSTEELASAIKAKPEFAKEYEDTRLIVSLTKFSEVQKAQFYDVTYRRLHTFICHMEDTAYWNPREEKWEEEWNNTFGKDLEKVPEIVDYWSDYKAKNSLSRFAKVELTRFFTTYYEYIGGVKDAYICFKITPLDGAIEQIKFTYSYGYKINRGKAQKSHKCIHSSPIYQPTELAWELDYSEQDLFGNTISSEFFEKYDMNIEITDIRKDGKNYSLEDLKIPEVITAYWAEDWNPQLDDKVAVLINPDYVSLDTYIQNKKNEELKQYDSLCEAFTEVVRESSMDLESTIDNLGSALDDFGSAIDDLKSIFE